MHATLNFQAEDQIYLYRFDIDQCNAMQWIPFYPSFLNSTEKPTLVVVQARGELLFYSRSVKPRTGGFLLNLNPARDIKDDCHPGLDIKDDCHPALDIKDDCHPGEGEQRWPWMAWGGLPNPSPGGRWRLRGQPWSAWGAHSRRWLRCSLWWSWSWCWASWRMWGWCWW